MYSRKALKKWEVRVLEKILIRSYFDSNIFKKVMEDVTFPPIAKEILEPLSMPYKHRFLFPEIKPVLKEKLEEMQRDIEEIVQWEMDFQEEVGYIKTGKKEKQQWFAQLREVYNLPQEYEFE